MKIFRKFHFEKFHFILAISIFSICGRNLELSNYNSFFRFFIENDIIPFNQSCFKPSDSCINQFLSVSHEIYKSLNDGYEVKGVLLHTSKAFDKI